MCFGHSDYKQNGGTGGGEGWIKHINKYKSSTSCLGYKQIATHLWNATLIWDLTQLTETKSGVMSESSLCGYYSYRDYTLLSPEYYNSSQRVFRESYESSETEAGPEAQWLEHWRTRVKKFPIPPWWHQWLLTTPVPRVPKPSSGFHGHQDHACYTDIHAPTHIFKK